MKGFLFYEDNIPAYRFLVVITVLRDFILNCLFIQLFLLNWLHLFIYILQQKKAREWDPVSQRRWRHTWCWVRLNESFFSNGIWTLQPKKTSKKIHYLVTLNERINYSIHPRIWIYYGLFKLAQLTYFSEKCRAQILATWHKSNDT